MFINIDIDKLTISIVPETHFEKQWMNSFSWRNLTAKQNHATIGGINSIIIQSERITHKTECKHQWAGSMIKCCAECGEPIKTVDGRWELVGYNAR